MNKKRLSLILWLAFASLVVAATCFLLLGGAVAKVTGEMPIAGLNYSAGGSLAAFIITFAMLFRAYNSKVIVDLSLGVTLSLENEQLARSVVVYAATINVLNPESGEEKQLESQPIWEPGGLTVYLNEIQPDALVKIILSNDAGGSWHSDYFSPLRPSVTLY